MSFFDTSTPHISNLLHFPKMLKKLFSILLILCLPLCAVGQKKDIAAARDLVKSGKDLSKAEDMMAKLLKDSVNLHNEKIWTVLFDAVKKQYDAGNEQLYLKNKYDTAQLFLNARKMFLIYEAYDSIEAVPGKNGAVVAKNRKKHADFLMPYRKNLYTGGQFFLHKKEFARAYDMLDTYLGCVSHPLFSSHPIASVDSHLSNAAYLALYSGYKLGDAGKTLKFKKLAMADTANMNNKYQYLAETYLTMKDTASYVGTMEEGFGKYPLSMYYFPRLFDYYFNIRRNFAKADTICAAALRSDSTNMVFLLAKSSLELENDDYDGCIRICDKLIMRSDTLADAYLNAGLAYYNQAIKAGGDATLARRNRDKLRSLYKSALPYLQRYRELSPSAQDRWAYPLYTIYLNLNMGKEFEEVEKLLKQGGK